MAKKIYILWALALLIFVGCNKEDNKVVDDNFVEDSFIEDSPSGLLFYGSTNQNDPTKSYFGDNSGTLYWSDDDVLGVYSTDADNSNSLIWSGIATITNKVSATQAVFCSIADKESWISNSNNITFYAYYPCSAASVPAYSASSKSVALTNVAVEQIGEFGKYHIMYSTPATKTATEIDRGDPIGFSFRPATSILRIRPYLSSTYPNDTYTVEKIEMTIADDKKICGDAILNLTNGELTPTSGATSTITINLTTPITITKNPTDCEYIDIALLPVVSDRAKLTFKFISQNDEIEFVGNKNSPSSFAKGKRYSADIRMIPLKDLFFFYGQANCLLLPNSQNNGTLDVAPYYTDSTFIYTKNSAAAIRPYAAKAEVIWEESAGFITSATISGTTMTVSKQADLYGNALIGIYDSGDNLLWSYHIWAPEDNPTNLAYTQTLSGDTYNVLSMPIGATKNLTLSSSSADRLKGYGLFYQWGRKDPLGRQENYSSLKSVYDKNGNTFSLTDSPYIIDIKDVLLSYTDVTTDGPKSHFMIRYTIANPAVYLVDKSQTLNYNWAVENNNFLWGNPYPSGTYPKMSQTYKSIFDPSPAGYRVAPADTWVNFTTTKANTNSYTKFNVVGNESFDWTWSDADANKDAHAGYSFYYQGLGIGPSHFYLYGGSRSSWNSSSYNNFAPHTTISSWSSAPSGTSSTYASSFSQYNTNISPFNNSSRAQGIEVRCVAE